MKDFFVVYEDGWYIYNAVCHYERHSLIGFTSQKGTLCSKISTPESLTAQSPLRSSARNLPITPNWHELC